MEVSKLVANFIQVSSPSIWLIEMLQSVLFAKLRFHDTTSKGRIINRFSKDIEGLDSSMADNCEYLCSVANQSLEVSSTGYLSPSRSSRSCGLEVCRSWSLVA